MFSLEPLALCFTLGVYASPYVLTAANARRVLVFIYLLYDPLWCVQDS